MNITDPIRRLAQTKPDAIAVVRGDETLVSYRDFDRMIDHLASRVIALGIGPDDVVGTAVLGLQGIALTLALARLGIASTDVALPARRQTVCFLPSGAEPPEGVRCIRLDPTWRRVPPADLAIPPATSQRDGATVCRIFGSSGTTGVTKFATISHDVMAGRVYSTWLALGAPKPVHVCAFGFGITRGFTSILRTFWGGATLVLTDPARIIESIGRHRVSSLAIAPVSLQGIVARLRDADGPLPSLEVIEVGGSLLPPRLAELTQQRLCPNIVITFGAMETGGMASGPYAAFARNRGAVGFMHAEVEAQAVDAADKPVPPGTEGALRIRSGNLVAGYLDEPELSERTFRDGWFYTGDVGTVSRDGLITIAGRTTEFINNGGNKVSPYLIEEVLLSVPAVTEAAAFGVPDTAGVTQIWAAIVAPVAVDSAMVVRLCNEKLRGKAPQVILQVRALPRNANGKVVREQLVQFALTHRLPGVTAARPR